MGADHDGGAAGEDGSGFLPVPVLDLELTRADQDATPNARGEAVVLARVHGVPVGGVSLSAPGSGPAGRASGTAVRDRVLEALADEVGAHLAADGLVGDLAAALVEARAVGCRARPAERPSTLVTVVVCTIGEDPRLLRTVSSVLGQSRADLELVVVDNRPATGRVPELLREVADPRLRVVAEPKRGLSAARNAGVRAARGELVAYTDDDAYADPDWVARLVEPFRRSAEVVCTTGLVLPSELETRAQLLFEEFGAFDKGFERTVWTQRPATAAGLGRRGEGGVLFPYSAGVYGSGNNMAFRRSWLEAHPFDESLGAGTVTRGGEDLDAFLRVVLEGRVLVYEPAAVVKHAGRRDMDALGVQMFGYGSGMSAVVAKHVLRPRRALAVARRLPSGLRKLLDPASEKNEGRTTAFPPELARAELRGYLAGPLLYARSRRQDRRADRELGRTTGSATTRR